MINPVGYLVQGAVANYQGQYYDYILGGNGLFISAHNDLISATISIARCEVRGLTMWAGQLQLKHGPIPVRLFNLALDYFLSQPEKEIYAAIVWDGEYHLSIPEQNGKAGSVEYQTPENVIMDLHSHGPMVAHFSGQDDKDEQGLRLYGIAGNLVKCPEVLFRIGVYGYWQIIAFCDVFDGPIEGSLDMAAVEEAEA